MTREEAIKGLKEIDIRDALQEDYDALYIAIKALEQEPKEWIPVSERLPKENGRYLVTMRYSTHDTIMVVGYTNNLYEVDEYDFVDCKRSGWYGYDSEYGFFEHDNVVAWQPLPKPYKESEDKE